MKPKERRMDGCTALPDNSIQRKAYHLKLSLARGKSTLKARSWEISLKTKITMFADGLRVRTFPTRNSEQWRGSVTSDFLETLIDLARRFNCLLLANETYVIEPEINELNRHFSSSTYSIH